MSLVARHLEEHGIATVVIGSALDIVERCGVPRFVFVDFPLGNPCGKPWDVAMQRSIVTQALQLLGTASEPQTVKAPFSWGDDGWRESYARVDAEHLEELRQLGAARRALQEARKRSSPGV